MTFSFSGLATQEVDYRVAPADADNGAPDHQVVLDAGARLARVTLSAMDDDDRDPGETIEISVTHAGEVVGSREHSDPGSRSPAGSGPGDHLPGARSNPGSRAAGTARGETIDISVTHAGEALGQREHSDRWITFARWWTYAETTLGWDAHRDSSVGLHRGSGGAWSTASE